MKFLPAASVYGILQLASKLCLVAHAAPAPLPPARSATNSFVGQHSNTDAACLSIHNSHSPNKAAYFSAIQSTDASVMKTTVEDRIIFKCEDTSPAHQRIGASVSGPFVMACAIGYSAFLHQATVNGRETQKGYCAVTLNGSGHVIRAGNTDCSDFSETELLDNLKRRYSVASSLRVWATTSGKTVSDEVISQALSITEISSGRDDAAPKVLISTENNDQVELANIVFRPGSILRVCATARQGLGNMVLHVGLGSF